MPHCDPPDAKALSRLPDDHLGVTVGIWPPLPAARSIAHYHLVCCIGQGGMGEVWLADQYQPVRRRVALKLIRAGMDSRDGVSRFQSEVQALALMDHPAIARVYDAGATPEQRPYFAMEYVPGLPITEYCDGKRLTVRERLQLFALVCEGVQHAHQKAIIHRDLKPSNILVSKIGGRSVPKIIDFGIAKALGSRLSSQTLCTLAGFPIGTPDYMSPEQALGDEDIDTRADIYSLGVVLYELLTGSLPFHSTSTKLPSDEFIRRLQEDDAPRPSTKVRESRASAVPSAGSRSSDPQALARELRGDLDAIVLKALEKDRKRRYSSASELAADIGLHLQNLPVTASPPTATYRVHKFVLRHRTMVSSAAGMLLLLISFAAIMTVQTVRIAQERDRADREAAAAKQTSDFLVKLFHSVNPSVTHGRQVTARDLLDAGVRQAAAALQNAPIAEARLHKAMGENYRVITEDAAAIEQFNRALDLADAFEGRSSIDSIGALDGLFHIYRDAGHRNKAAALAADMHQRTANLPVGSEGWARATRCTAEALSDSGEARRAELMLRQVLGSFPAQHNHRFLEAATLLSLANVLRSQSRFFEATEVSRQAVTLLEHHGQTSGPAMLEAKTVLASNLASEGHTEQALAILNRVRSEYERIFGCDHVQTLTSAYEIGIAQVHGGLPEQGVATLRDVARRTLASRGPDTPFTRIVLLGFGSVLQETGRAAEAESILRDCVARSKSAEGHEGRDTLAAEYQLALALEKLKRFTESEALLERVFSLRSRRSGLEHNHTLEALAALGTVAADQAHWGLAENRYRRAIELMIKTHTSPNQIHENQFRLATVLMQEGKISEAFDSLKQAVENGFAHGDWLDANTAFEQVRNTERYRQIRALIKNSGKLAVLLPPQ